MKKIPKNFRLSTETVAKLKTQSRRLKLTDTAFIELAIELADQTASVERHVVRERQAALRKK